MAMMEFKEGPSSFKRQRRFVRVPRSQKRMRLGVKRFRGRTSRLNGELKFHDVDLDDALIAATGTITPTVNIIAQGVTESDRVGRKCVIRSIQWRYNLNFISIADMATTSTTVRVIMYVDKQANGATAAVTDLLESDNYQSYNNLSNSGRFLVLHDKFHVLHSPAAIAGPVTSELDRNGVFYKKCEIPIEFSSTLGVIAEIRSNNIGVLLIARVGAIVKFDSKIRLRFSDS